MGPGGLIRCVSVCLPLCFTEGCTRGKYKFPTELNLLTYEGRVGVIEK